LDLLAQVREKMQATNALHIVEGGDHSLLVTKSHLKASGERQPDVDQRILQTIEKFLHEQIKLSSWTCKQ
jgi:hypothetical protein